ncbi:hypothetical protein PIB19_18415 [Sphingomonas sp. 7/4-4]|uniref:hypothetical protein n=1 Tax=Sphingomonas sp. 7/4-4 TaxID=3018446 RepID=UPI0022F3BE8F|nr:hypothetical protein [Sphingomonas sp. 7/4-4]WBY07321.1 hypothetical protein PIB19_18415 [Sphingomonas sp. 7/4-4]
MATSGTGRGLAALAAAAALSGLLPQSAPAQETAPAFHRADWQEDFGQLKAALERSYVNLAWMGSPQSGVDVPRLERRARDALAAAITDAEAEHALLEFVAGFHDGHLSPLPRLAASTVPAVPEPADAPLDPQNPDSGCAALGYAASSPIAFTLPFESLPGFVMAGDGLTEPFRSGLVPAPDGRRIGIVRIQEFEPTAFPAVCTRAWAALRAANSPLTPGAIEDAASDAWFAALAETLAQLRKQGAAAVLVDIGRNSGGGDSGDWMPRMFTDRAVSSAPMLMVDAPISAQYFDEQIRSMDKGLAAHPAADGAQALGRHAGSSKPGRRRSGSSVAISAGYGPSSARGTSEPATTFSPRGLRAVPGAACPKALMAIRKLPAGYPGPLRSNPISAPGTGPLMS